MLELLQIKQDKPFWKRRHKYKQTKKDITISELPLTKAQQFQTQIPSQCSKMWTASKMLRISAQNESTKTLTQTITKANPMNEDPNLMVLMGKDGERRNYTVEEAGIRVRRQSAVDSVVEFRTDAALGELFRGVDGDRRIEAAGVARRKPERRRIRTWRERVERIEARI